MAKAKLYSWGTVDVDFKDGETHWKHATKAKLRGKWFAVHRQLEPDHYNRTASPTKEVRYSITHTPTGYSLLFYDRERDCWPVIDRLTALQVDWPALTPETARSLPDRDRQAIKAALRTDEQIVAATRRLLTAH